MNQICGDSSDYCFVQTLASDSVFFKATCAQLALKDTVQSCFETLDNSQITAAISTVEYTYICTQQQLHRCITKENQQQLDPLAFESLTAVHELVTSLCAHNGQIVTGSQAGNISVYDETNGFKVIMTAPSAVTKLQSTAGYLMANDASGNVWLLDNDEHIIYNTHLFNMPGGFYLADCFTRSTIHNQYLLTCQNNFVQARLLDTPDQVCFSHCIAGAKCVDVFEKLVIVYSDNEIQVLKIDAGFQPIKAVQAAGRVIRVSQSVQNGDLWLCYVDDIGGFRYLRCASTDIQISSKKAQVVQDDFINDTLLKIRNKRKQLYYPNQLVFVDGALSAAHSFSEHCDAVKQAQKCILCLNKFGTVTQQFVGGSYQLASGSIQIASPEPVLDCALTDSVIALLTEKNCKVYDHESKLQYQVTFPRLQKPTHVSAHENLLCVAFESLTAVIYINSLPIHTFAASKRVIAKCSIDHVAAVVDDDLIVFDCHALKIVSKALCPFPVTQLMFDQLVIVCGYKEVFCLNVTGVYCNLYQIHTAATNVLWHSTCDNDIYLHCIDLALTSAQSAPNITKVHSDPQINTGQDDVDAAEKVMFVAQLLLNSALMTSADFQERETAQITADNATIRYVTTTATRGLTQRALLGARLLRTREALQGTINLAAKGQLTELGDLARELYDRLYTADDAITCVGDLSVVRQPVAFVGIQNLAQRNEAAWGGDVDQRIGQEKIKLNDFLRGVAW